MFPQQYDQQDDPYGNNYDPNDDPYQQQRPAGMFGPPPSQGGPLQPPGPAPQGPLPDAQLQPPPPPPELSQEGAPPIEPPRAYPSRLAPPVQPQQPSFPMPPEAGPPPGLQMPRESPQYTADQARLATLLANPPPEKKPSIWGRLGSMALGGMQGYLSGAPGGGHPDYSAAQTELLHPGQAEMQRQWQQNVGATQAAVAMGRQSRMDEGKLQYDTAHAQEALGRAAWMKDRGANDMEKNTVEVTPQMLERLQKHGLDPSKLGTRISRYEEALYTQAENYANLNLSKDTRAQLAADAHERTQAENRALKEQIAQADDVRKRRGDDMRAATARVGFATRAAASRYLADVGADTRSLRILPGKDGKYHVVDLQDPASAEPTNFEVPEKPGAMASIEAIWKAAEARKKGGNATAGGPPPSNGQPPPAKNVMSPAEAAIRERAIKAQKDPNHVVEAARKSGLLPAK